MSKTKTSTKGLGTKTGVILNILKMFPKRKLTGEQISALIKSEFKMTYTPREVNRFLYHIENMNRVKKVGLTGINANGRKCYQWLYSPKSRTTTLSKPVCN